MTDNTENTANESAATAQQAQDTGTTETIERHSYDVVVIGAGGAGLRAAIEARHAGKRVAIISKSLFGKAQQRTAMYRMPFTAASANSPAGECGVDASAKALIQKMPGGL